MKVKAVLLFGIVFFLSASFFPAFRQIHNEPTQRASKSREPANVSWMSLDEIEQALKKEKRKVMVVLFTDWCGWCKRLERETLQNEEVASYLNEKYYAIRFNAEEHRKVQFKGREYKYVQNGRRGYNQLAYELTRGRLSYPTCVFLDEKLELIQSIPGYKSPKDFHTIIRYFGDDYYKKMPWDTYLRQSRD